MSAGPYSCAVRAQGQTNAAQTARIKAGPLGLTPSFSLIAGTDNNVFNEGVDPKQDYTSRATPQLAAWIHAGRVQLQSINSMTAVYFKKYPEQRSLNIMTGGRIDIDLGRFTPYAGAALIRTRDRPSLEIDTRAQHRDQTFEAGTAARLSSKVSVVTGASRSTTSFADEAVFEGVNLQQRLNHTRTGASAGLRIAATPITTLSFAGTLEKDEFEFSPERNASGIRFGPTFEFSPFALVSGRATVAVRRFDPTDPRLPDFTGVATAIDLTYVMRGRTRFSTRVDRDVSYSFSSTQPYYLLTGAQIGIAQRISDGLEVLFTYGIQRLDYRALNAAPPDISASAIDSGTTVGVSLTQLLQSHTRVGFTADYIKRTSGLVTQRYDDFRLGAIVSYGF